MIVLEDESVANVPDENGRRTVRQWAATAVLGVLFLLVTQGPVYWVRLEVAPFSGSFVQDRWIQNVFVTSTAVVLALALPGVRVLVRDRLVTVAFVAFLGTMVVSSFWSVAVPVTAQQSTMLALSTAAAVFAGAYVRRFDALVALWLAMQVGIGISLFAWWRDWPLALSRYGDLAGIYLNKNSFGPVAVIGAASSVAVVLAARSWTRWVLVPLGVACAVVDAYAWVRSSSFTPLLSLVIAVTVTVLLSLFVPGRRVRVRRAVGLVAAVASVALAAAAVASRDRFNELLDRPSLLTGRPTIWDVVLEYAAERPIAGWGLYAVWEKPNIIESLQARGSGIVFDAHSGYLEVLVGVGIVGLVSLVVLVLVALARVGAVMWRAPSVLSAWSVGVVVFTVAANFFESFVWPNLLVWMLLCVATGQAVAVRLRLSGPTGDDVDVPSIGSDAPPLEPEIDRDTPPVGLLIQTVSDDFDAFDFSFDDDGEWGDTGDGESGDEIAVAP